MLESLKSACCQNKCQADLGYMVRSCLKTETKANPKPKHTLLPAKITNQELERGLG